MAQVVVQLEIGVFLPVPQAHAQHRAQIERRDGVRMLAPFGQQVVHKVGPGIAGRGKDVQPRHMHGLVAGFHPEEGGIGGAQGMHGRVL